MKNSLKALAAVGAISAAMGYAALSYAGDLLFKRGCVPPESVTKNVVKCDQTHLGDYLQNNLRWVEEYGYERHFIVSDRGERLVGYLLRAKEESNVYVFAAHGYRSYGKKEFSGVGQYYLSRGINLFIVDHIASGESEGDYCTFGHNETKDCLKWLDYMNANFGSDIKIILHGVSMGSATVMMMTGSGLLPTNVRATVADCGFTDGPEFFAYRLRQMKIPAADSIVQSWIKINRRRLGFDLNNIKPVISVKNAEIPMLFIHGETDGLVPCFMVYELYEACGSKDKELLVIADADHAQSYKVGKEKYTDRLGAFIDKYVI